MNKDEWLAICNDIVYRHDRERLMCMSVAPDEQRDSLLALLAFNHEISIIPELVSETMLGEIRLQWWRETIIAIYEGAKPDHPVAHGLAWAIENCQLSENLFVKYLAARSFDLLRTPPASLAELEKYAKGTAGSLHELMAEVLIAKPNLKIRQAARNVGTAWALAGLLSAISFHKSQGRSYLPADLHAEDSVIAVAKSAKRYVDEARNVHQHIPHHLLPLMLTITFVDYDLRKLARCNYDPNDTRLKSPGISRLFSFYWKVLRKRY